MNHDSCCLELPGLDGSNPLAFLAALGVLKAAACVRRESRLSWKKNGFGAQIWGWREDEKAVLVSSAVALIARACAILSETAYPSEIPALNARKSREFCLSGIASQDALQIDLAESLFCEGARFLWEPNQRQKKKGVEPEERARGSRLCNADNPGGKRLVGMFRQFPQLSASLGGNVQEPRQLDYFIREALDSWRYHSPSDYSGSVKFPAFRWDPAENRPAAHEAENPDSDNLPSVPGANALAVIGSTFFTSVPTPDIATACVLREDGRDSFVWPLWEPTLSCELAHALLTQPSRWLDTAIRCHMGIIGVFRCVRQTTDNGSHFFLDSMPV